MDLRFGYISYEDKALRIIDWVWHRVAIQYAYSQSSFVRSSASHLPLCRLCHNQDNAYDAIPSRMEDVLGIRDDQLPGDGCIRAVCHPLVFVAQIVPHTFLFMHW